MTKEEFKNLFDKYFDSVRSYLFYRGAGMDEASDSVNLPTTQDVNISYPAKTFYSVSIGYMLPIARR